jgi:hypothetical protein
MVEEKYIELMNREIDGLNSREESAGLKKILRANPEAERYYRELCFVAGVLSRAPEIQPPAELKAAIITSIFGKETEKLGAGVTVGAGARVAAGRVRRSASILDIFRIRWEPRLAYVLAACLAVGIFLFVLFWRVVPGRAPRDLEALYGSIVANQQVGQLITAQPVEFALPGIGGQLHARYERKRILAAFDLHSDSRIQVRFNFAASVSLESIAALNKCQYSEKAGDGGFELTHSGDCRYVIVLQDKSGTHSPIGIKVLREGVLLFETTLQPER